MSTKEVRFDEYCIKCKHYDKSEAEDPCWDCLNQGWNIDSHKPVYWEENTENGTNRIKEKVVNKGI